jgi:hypothetical protein
MRICRPALESGYEEKGSHWLGIVLLHGCLWKARHDNAVDDQNTPTCFQSCISPDRVNVKSRLDPFVEGHQSTLTTAREWGKNVDL